MIMYILYKNHWIFLQFFAMSKHPKFEAERKDQFSLSIGKYKDSHPA